MIIPKELNQIIVCDPDILGGSPCFIGTRVPLATFIDHIESGYSLDQFLKGYSGVHREHAQQVLAWFSDQGRQAIGLELAS